MSPLFFAGLLAALIALLTAILACPLVTRLAMAIRAVDYPGGRRSQKEAVPRMGGVAIAAGIAAGAVLPNLFLSPQWSQNVTASQLYALMLGAALVFIIGAADDVVGLSPTQRFLVQLMAAIWVV